MTSQFVLSDLGNQYSNIINKDIPFLDQWVKENIGLSLTKKELNLFDVKWFDYRELHPLLATCLFCETYKKTYSKIMLTHGRDDYKVAQYRIGLKQLPYTQLQKMNITGLWKARQMADSMCVDYKYFISTLMSISCKRDWVNLPRPSHLRDSVLIEIFKEKLETRQKTALISSDLDYFKLDDDTYQSATTLQKQHVQFVLEQIRKRPLLSRHFALFSAMHIKKILPRCVAQQNFPTEYEKAIKLIN